MLSVLCRPMNVGKVGLDWVVLCCLALTECSEARMGENVNTDMVASHLSQVCNLSSSVLQSGWEAR